MTTIRVTRPAALEPMESRRLLSAAVVDGVLVLTGTAAAEHFVVVWWTGDLPATYHVAIDRIPRQGPGEDYTFSAGGVRAIDVRAGAGNDVVDLAAATIGLPAVVGIGPPMIPSRIDGGLGDDELHGTHVRDSITGGFGRDEIRGWNGADLILGGYGNDRAHGGGGNDTIRGGPGDDRLTGDDGNDRLFGESGDDWLGAFVDGVMSPERGDDLLVGGYGADTLMGGNGDDRLFGGPGRDRFFSSDRPTEMIDRTPDEPISGPPPNIL